MFQVDFWKKISFALQGGFDSKNLFGWKMAFWAYNFEILTLQKYPFLLKMVFLSLNLQNCASDFDDFSTDIRDICLEWFGLSAVC